MSVKTLDRTQWSYAEALEHVQNVTVARRATEAAKLPPKPRAAHEQWGPPQDPTYTWKVEAGNELLVALRDGDLLSQGRYTEERTGWAQGDFSGFGLHSGYHSTIRPEQWREGKYRMGALTGRDWEFIDIRMPRFMVKAIWPDFVPETTQAKQGAAEVPYTTPYLELMQEAISRFGLSASNQSKKENLSDWFLEQHIEGEGNIAQPCQCHGHADQVADGAARRCEAGQRAGFPQNQLLSLVWG